MAAVISEVEAEPVEAPVAEPAPVEVRDSTHLLLHPEEKHCGDMWVLENKVSRTCVT